ncbi:unnamed protein product, partial [marine sediment metagenome]
LVHPAAHNPSEKQCQARGWHLASGFNRDDRLPRYPNSIGEGSLRQSEGFSSLFQGVI